VGLAVFTFFTVFVLIASGGLLFFFRVGMTQRLSSAIGPAEEREPWWSRFRPSRARDSIRSIIQPLEKVLPKSPQEVSVAQKRLMYAGFRENSHLRVFYGLKALLPVWFCLMVAVSGVTDDFNPFIAYTVAAAFGYLAPDFWLGRRIRRRRANIQLALPDFLDLLVVCVEAGLSMDQALQRTTREMRLTSPDIADEMGLVSLEQRAGRPRADAWKNLAGRVELDVLRMLVTAIVQADQFGTSIAKTLRTYAEGLRTRRRQQVEELAAKMAVKLVLPLVVFVFPCIFIVALGPSLLTIGEQFQKYFGG
jgi:tight adherence protein C